MNGFVVGITLGQQVPLRAGIQNPEDRIQDGSRGHRFASRAAIRNVLFGEVFQNAVPLIVTQAEHNRTYRDMNSSLNYFEIGSSQLTKDLM